MNREPSAETWVDRSVRYYKNECSRVLGPLSKRAITRTEYEELIRQYHSRQRYRLIFEILWNCGMRPKEACWLHRSNFSEDFRILEYKIGKPKHKIINGIPVLVHKCRRIPIPEDLANRISKYWEGIKFISPYGYLFPSYCYSRFKKYEFYINPLTLNWEIDKHRKLFGGRWLERTYEGDHVLGPRSFRISWITRYGKRCKDIFETAKAIGHDDPRTTAAYFDPVSMKELEQFQKEEEIRVNVPELCAEQTRLQAYT